MQNFWHQMKIAWYTYSLFRDMWQYHKYMTLTLSSETRSKKVTNSVNLSCLLRYYVTHRSSFLSYSMSDFHCFPSANITSSSTISGMDGNSSNSFGILRHSSLFVIILFHSNWVLHVSCWCMCLTSYAQDSVACQWLVWLSSMFKI